MTSEGYFGLGILLFAAIVFGMLGFIVYTTHAENIACIQAGKSLVGTSCVKLAGDQQ